MIHATAIVHPGANIEEGVEMGPYAVVGEHVSIAAGTVIGPHAVIEGWTEIGRDNRIFQFASVGCAPQDLKYAGEKTFLRIGERNTIREFTTFSTGTEGGGGETVVGNDNLFMAYSHVAHDCRVGNHIVMANGATLAGHVEVDDYAIIGGLSAVHQFCRVGCHVMIAGGSIVTQDVPPYCIAQGDRAKTVGLNSIGLKRRGFSSETIRSLKEGFKQIFRAGQRLEDAIESLSEQPEKTPELENFLRFIKKSQRGIAR